MSAASAAATPAGASSTTAHRAGATSSWAAACRNRSGAGLPAATSSALNIRPSNRSISPAVVSVIRMRSWIALDATHTAMPASASASSTAATPGIGCTDSASRG